MFLRTIGVSESPCLSRSPLLCSVPWHHNERPDLNLLTSSAIHLCRVYKRHVRWEGTSQRHKSTCDTLMLLHSTLNSSVSACWNPQLLANWIGKKTFQKGTFDLKGPKLNVLIRDKISFVGVAHLTRGDVILIWRLYLPGVEPEISRSWLKY